MLVCWAFLHWGCCDGFKLISLEEKKVSPISRKTQVFSFGTNRLSPVKRCFNDVDIQLEEDVWQVSAYSSEGKVGLYRKNTSFQFGTNRYIWELYFKMLELCNWRCYDKFQLILTWGKKSCLCRKHGFQFGTNRLACWGVCYAAGLCSWGLPWQVSTFWQEKKLMFMFLVF
jgi:hypothetical protein